MSAVGGTIRDGKIVLDRPVDWAEGTRVYVQLLPEYGLIEGVWPDDGSPEGRAEILRGMAEFEPVEFSPEDQAPLAAARDESNRGNGEAARGTMGLTP